MIRVTTTLFTASLLLAAAAVGANPEDADSVVGSAADSADSADMVGEVAAAPCGWPALGPSLKPLTDDLTSDRFGGLPRNRLQATAWYDGRGTAQVGIHFLDAAGQSVWAVIDVDQFDRRIETWEYDISGLTITGIFSVRDVVRDGVIDGVAFGLYWKDAAGRYHHMQSSDDSASTRSSFVGAWPIAHNCDAFRVRTPQLSNGHGRAQARMMLFGSRYLDNGCYLIPTAVGRRLP